MVLKQGFIFLEVLISLLILSCLLLGLDAIQLTALQKIKTAYYFSVANQQLSNITEELALSSDINTRSAVKFWNQQNQLVLPQGHGNVVGRYPSFAINIFWGDAKAQLCQQNRIGLSGCLHIDTN